MRKFNWPIPILVVLILVGYAVIWPWYRDRNDAAVVEELTADLTAAATEIDRIVAEAPEKPTLADLEKFTQLNKKLQELEPRMRVAAPKLRGETGKRFIEAQDEYLTKLDLMGAKFTAMKKKFDSPK